jgi:hypothetical protein
MRVLLSPCLGLILMLGTTPAGVGYLYAPSFDVDAEPSGHPTPYRPEPGDIFLSGNPRLRARIVYALAGTGAPHHSGIVIALPDGSRGVLEAGPGETLKIEISDPFGDFLLHTERGGRVWIRRRATPLTPEQSCRLTEFAQVQTGKRFAALRLMAQLSPFRCRAPLRTRWLGKPHGERSRYFCSELVMEACVAAGVIDAERARPGATYPRDLFLGRSNNRFLDANLQINDGWLPPARWLPGAEATAPSSDAVPLRR